MIKNALFMAPMTTWSSNADLTVSNEDLKYYERRAHNVDYVITGCTFTIRTQQGFPNQFCAGSDDYLDSLRSLSQAIHRGGAQAILQVHSPGRMVSPDLQPNPEIDVVDASADFADCLIGTKNRRLGCRATVSFDVKASKLSGFMAA